MKDRISDLTSFEKEVQKSVKRVVHQDSEILRNEVIDNTKFFYDNLTFYHLKDLSLDDFVRLAISSWYLPEEVGFVLRMDLELKLKNFSLDDRSICEILLSSKTEMLLFLQETHLWHSREFFGNIFGKNVNLAKYFRLSPVRKKVKKLQRKSGYDDLGSRVPDSKWKPRFDWSLTTLQNEIESKRQSQQDTLNFLKGFLW